MSLSSAVSEALAVAPKSAIRDLLVSALRGSAVQSMALVPSTCILGEIVGIGGLSPTDGILPFPGFVGGSHRGSGGEPLGLVKGLRPWASFMKPTRPVAGPGSVDLQLSSLFRSRLDFFKGKLFSW
jgi:hypothetical protein